MTSFGDNLGLGLANPVIPSGASPLGRIAFHNVVPLTLGANNIALSQHMTASTGLTLTAGTGVTKIAKPDLSGGFAYQLDTNRCVSIASTSDLHLINFTIVGFDIFNRLQTNTIVGPNNSTVVSTKAFASVVSVTPDTTDGAHNVTVGTADKFGLPWAIYDAGYIMPKWAETLAQDAGTFVAGDATSPATATTTDPRGTYAPSSASDGVKRLVCWLHLTNAQCGPSATQQAQIGVDPV